MSRLEYIEWCDFWIEDQENVQKPRVLLVGDSITRDYKGPVMELLQNEVTVNMMASSRGMDNEDYFEELGYILNKDRFRYSTIHLNNGLHANHLTADEYENLLEKTVQFIRMNSNAPIIIALSTPVYRNEIKYGNEDNDRVLERNIRAAMVAEKYGLAVNDLYTLSYNKEEIRNGDGLHYNQLGSRLQAEQVVKYLKTVL
ncbi:MAG TPA: SGNH/GDSL hydrolase family protein [Mobilitalea sp.]|nr:SGNH/GDSL hydrolase family protein [Mobilitalea sp.]